MSGAFPASKPDWSNINVIHRNVLPPRSTFFLYSDLEDALSHVSDRSCSLKLSGTWKFHHCNNPFDAPQGFENSTYDASQWANIQVPGHWQLQGWARPHYSNVNFIIPVDPPNVPFEGNQTGCYVRKFTVPEEFSGQQVRLRFEGVDSAFHVYVNGSEVGYSQGARNPSEFNISSVVDYTSENSLAVKVYQYCDGSYLEDQDQWRLNGIFRDVFLLAFPESHIKDFHVLTVLDDHYRNAHLNVNVSAAGGGHIQLNLLSNIGETIAAEGTQIGESGSACFSIPVEDPRKWSAEDPQLYKLVLSFGGRFIVQNVGFRRIEMKEGIFTVNGKRIVFRGVNRHEHHPLHGRAVPYDFMMKDLLLMKKHNINSIRTSHQPSDPRLYELADELGFWIVDEADVECHGLATVDRLALSEDEKNKPYHERVELIYGKAGRWTSDNPKWKDQYVDRALQLCMRDKNSPSVALWSLGNEAFYGCNFRSMYDAIKSIDQSRPVHYEGDRETESSDIWSQMYVHPDRLTQELEKPNHDTALILCEFAHAMGNGPGNLKEYIDLFYAHPRLQGGHVWEWSNHGLTTQDRVTGDKFPAYGGDFGDVPNNATFCLDGLVSSDHIPTPGLVEYSKAIEPVQVLVREGQSVKIINRYDIISLDHLSCKGFIVGDGHRTSLGPISIPTGIAPHAEALLTIPELAAFKASDETFIELHFRTKNTTLWADAGHLVASSQLQLQGPTKVAATPAPASSTLGLTATPTSLTISSFTSVWVFSLTSGRLISWKKSNTELIHPSHPLEMGVYRANTDNDVKIDGANWNEMFVQLSAPHTRSVRWSTNSDTSSIEVIVESRLAPPVLSWSISTTTSYTFSGAGTLHIHCAGAPDAGLNLPLTLPRLGFSLALPASFNKVQWFGRGPGESYKDKKHSQLVGNWAAHVDELFVNYDHPQESSNRTDVRWVRFSSCEEASLTARFGMQDGFSFMAAHYTAQDIEEAKHTYDLKRAKKDYIVLRLDADHHGLGTGACGPKTIDKYALVPKPFVFEIDLE